MCIFAVVAGAASPSCVAVCHSGLEVECILVVESALGHELTSASKYGTSRLHP